MIAEFNIQLIFVYFSGLSPACWMLEYRNLNASSMKKNKLISFTGKYVLRILYGYADSVETYFN